MAIKFRAPSGEVRVALLTGHVTIIGSEWQDLEPRFHRQALALGAISQELPQEEAPALDAPIDLSIDDVVKATIVRMLDRVGEPGSELDFTGQGYPQIGVLKTLAGINVDRETMNRCFEEVSKIDERAKRIRERARKAGQ
jgi:hypothetical protein